MARSSKKSRFQAKKSQQSCPKPKKRIPSKQFGAGRKEMALRRAEPLAKKISIRIVPQIEAISGATFVVVARRPESDLLAIAPRSGLYLHPRGHGNDQRFAVVFKRTWARIPQEVRQHILEHWHKSDCRRLTQLVYPEQVSEMEVDDLSELLRIRWVVPKVELLSGWVGRDEEDIVPAEKYPRGSGLGHVYAKGCIMRFHAPSIDRMPDATVRHLIAHEIAHVFQNAVGDEYLFGPDWGKPNQGDYEQNADEIMEEWGFKPFAVDAWAADQGLVERVECKDAREYIERRYGKGSRYSTE